MQARTAAVLIATLIATVHVAQAGTFSCTETGSYVNGYAYNYYRPPIVTDSGHSQSSSATGCTLTDTQTATLNVGLGPNSDGSYNYNFQGGSSFTVAASATGGSLHATATALASDSPAQYLTTNSQAIINPIYNMEGAGVVYVSWQDALTICDPGAAANAAVQIQLGGSVSGSLSTSWGCAPAGLTSNASYQAIFNLEGSGIGPVLTGDTLSQCNGGPPPVTSGSNQLTTTLYNGRTYAVSARLVIETDSKPGYCNFTSVPCGYSDPNFLQDFVSNTTSVANFADTANFYAQILTPGAYYTDSAGNINPFLPSNNPGGSTSVPEPATLGLLGLGLAGVVFMRKRKAS